jgi:hypothetical protein
VARPPQPQPSQYPVPDFARLRSCSCSRPLSGRERVGGDHPAALRGELRGEVELVAVLRAVELVGHQWQLLLVRAADEPELADGGDPPGQVARVGLHGLHDVAVAVLAEPDEVVVPRQHHRGAGGEVQCEGGVALAQVVLVEDQVLAHVAALAEAQPPDPRVHPI